MFHLLIRYSHLHVSSFTAREGSIVLELNAVTLPNASPPGESRTEDLPPASLPLDPVVWLNLMQVHQMLSANATVSILVGSVISKDVLDIRVLNLLHNIPTVDSPISPIDSCIAQHPLKSHDAKLLFVRSRA